MFGEDLIIGETNVKMDDKYRICIPNFTKVAPNDSLLIQVVTDENSELALKIFALNNYIGIINRFKNLRNNSTSIEEYEKYDEEIARICKKLDALCKVDNTTRLIIPYCIRKRLELSPKSELTIKGLGDSILVRKK